MDRVFYKYWADTHVQEIPDKHHRKEDGPRETFLLPQENLDGKLQAEHQETCCLGDNYLCQYYKSYYTYNLATPNAGDGVQSWFGVEFFQPQMGQFT